MFAHSRAPVRIGLAGGGTDLPVWTRERTGRCLSLAVRMYAHAVAIARPDGQVVASYRKRDVSTAATEIANGLIRESALLHGWEEGFEVHTLSELSSRGSGLGVSSSIAVALAACFQRMALIRKRAAEGPRSGDFLHIMLDGEGLRPVLGDHVVHEDDPAARMTVARDAWTVEIDRLKRPIGRQDHMAAAHGGLRLYSFSGEAAQIERSFTREEAEWVAAHVLLVRLPEGHDSRALLSGVKSTTALEEAMNAVPLAVSAVEERDARKLGYALSRGQTAKTRIRGAVPSWLAEILDRIRSSGAGVYGCKVSGAGGGGHVIVGCVDCGPNTIEIIERATNLPVVKIEADFDGVRSDGWA